MNQDQTKKSKTGIPEILEKKTTELSPSEYMLHYQRTEAQKEYKRQYYLKRKAEKENLSNT